MIKHLSKTEPCLSFLQIGNHLSVVWWPETNIIKVGLVDCSVENHAFAVVIISILCCNNEELFSAGTMLIKTRLGDVQKFVRISEPNLTEFLNAGKKLSLKSSFALEA